ncbi:unnamed protein product [Soboliphyme baturini]|uniref:Uncharacterized protein n=1 Tax=Soboliphyme baturini TaxID=241478 RepID=A0A183IFV3_9BILA|nr:unnamed protein product [Soboliphyme baturini]
MDPLLPTRLSADYRPAKGDVRECSNYRAITLLSLPCEFYSRVIQWRRHGIARSKIQEEQCGFQAEADLIRYSLCAKLKSLEFVHYGFIAECDVAVMRVHLSNTESLVFVLLSVTLRINWGVDMLMVVFADDEKFEEAINRRIEAASGILRELARSIMTKAELSQKTMLSVFQSIFIPILTYGHESWTMIEMLRSRVQDAEMGFLSRISTYPGIQTSEISLAYIRCFSRLRSHSWDGLGMCCECLQKGRLSKCVFPNRPTEGTGDGQD